MADPREPAAVTPAVALAIRRGGWDGIACWRPIPRALRATIPTCRGVYVFLTTEGRVAYIGKTSDHPGAARPGSKRGLRGRISSNVHIGSYIKKYGDAYGPLGGIIWRAMPELTDSEVYRFEQRLIAAYLPWAGNSARWRARTAAARGFTIETWPEPAPWRGPAPEE